MWENLREVPYCLSWEEKGKKYRCFVDKACWRLGRYFFQHLYLYISRILSGHSPSISNFWEPHPTGSWFMKTLTLGSGQCYLDVGMTQGKLRCWDNYIYSVSSQNFSGWRWQHHSGFGKGRGGHWYLSGLSKTTVSDLALSSEASCPYRVATTLAPFLGDLLWKWTGLSLLAML